MKAISKKEFDKLTGDAVIEFYAPWCEPCSRMADVLDEVRSNNKKLDFYKVNTDEESQLTSQNAVMSIPTVIYYKSGKPEARSIGVKSKEEIEKMINEIY